MASQPGNSLLPKERLFFAVMSDLVQAMCAPFWWTVGGPGAVRILHNGTICFVDTGSRQIGITANHVYQAYLDDLEQHGTAAIECQFGSSTISPARHAVAQSERLDIATFDVPAVFVGASTQRPKTHHHAVRWPPRRVEKSEVVVYGGYPGALREEKGNIAEMPYQWIASRVNDVSEQNIVLEPKFDASRWLGDERNDDPGGWSGGPVFRYAHEGPIERLELVGVIYEFPLGQAVLARHADAVLADGGLR
jgi:hypothetical protein